MWQYFYFSSPHTTPEASHLFQHTMATSGTGKPLKPCRRFIFRKKEEVVVVTESFWEQDQITV